MSSTDLNTRSYLVEGDEGTYWPKWSTVGCMKYKKQLIRLMKANNQICFTIGQIKTSSHLFILKSGGVDPVALGRPRFQLKQDVHALLTLFFFNKNRLLQFERNIKEGKKKKGRKKIGCIFVEIQFKSHRIAEKAHKSRLL